MKLGAGVGPLLTAPQRVLGPLRSGEQLELQGYRLTAEVLLALLGYQTLYLTFGRLE